MVPRIKRFVKIGLVEALNLDMPRAQCPSMAVLPPEAGSY